MSMTYQDCMAYLAKAKDPRNGRPVAKGTRIKFWMPLESWGGVARCTPRALLTYHYSILVEWQPTMTFVTNDGYMTKTVKNRINDYLPHGYHIQQVKNQWVITNPERMVKTWLPSAFTIAFTHDGQLEWIDEG